MKAAFYALGCKVNQYEIDCCARIFRENGWEIGSFDEPCDAYIINTCSVTNISDRKSRQILRRAKKNNPLAVVGAMGCYVQIKSEDVENMPEVDFFVGNSKKSEIYELTMLALDKKAACEVTDIMKQKVYEELECEGHLERTRAYIKIEDGCNNFCSYCIIPYARGPVRSRKLENIVSEAKRLSDNGFCEIVLTGISVSSYGQDLKDGASLIDVIDRVSEVKGIKRIRLSSIDPRAFTEEFTERLKENKKVCRHFHISLQSGCDTVLKRMNRKYTAGEYLETLRRIREKMPGCAITTDVICGFPGETEDEFYETVEFVKKAEFSKVHIFPYSERSHTLAAKMEQLPMNVREERCKILSCEEEAVSEKFAKSMVGKTESVLYEKSESGVWEGFTGNYMRVYTKSDASLENTVSEVVITEYKDGKLWASLKS